MQPVVFLAYHNNDDGVRELWRGNGLTSERFPPAVQAHLEARSWDDPRMAKFISPFTSTTYEDWDEVPSITTQQLWIDLGHPRTLAPK
jgi:hypothetical protein